MVKKGNNLMRGKLQAIIGLVLGLGILSAVGASDVLAHSAEGDLFYTTFSGTDRLFTREYDFDGAALTYGAESTIAGAGDGLTGADGLVFDPTDTDFMLVGSQGGVFFRVNVATGATTASTSFAGSGASIFHLAIDPSGTSVWGTGIPDSPVVNLSLTPFDSGSTVLPIIDAAAPPGVTSITGLAFTGGGTAYYTASGPGGTGSFGIIDLVTGETSNIATSVTAAHGIAFDPFTGHFLLFGDDEISQYDPVGGTFVSTFSAGDSGLQFDQGSPDGEGHVFVAENNGDMLFLDYFSTGLVGSASFSDLRFFKANLDDVAPIVGAPDRGVIPEPSSMMLLGMGGVAGLIRRKKSRKA